MTINVIECPVCTKPTPSTRVGTQDSADIYVCKEQHLTRIRIGAPRKVWNELASGNSEPTQGA